MPFTRSCCKVSLIKKDFLSASAVNTASECQVLISVPGEVSCAYPFCCLFCIQGRLVWEIFGIVMPDTVSPGLFFHQCSPKLIAHPQAVSCSQKRIAFDLGTTVSAPLLHAVRFLFRFSKQVLGPQLFAPVWQSF